MAEKQRIALTDEKKLRLWNWMNTHRDKVEKQPVEKTVSDAVEFLKEPINAHHIRSAAKLLQLKLPAKKREYNDKVDKRAVTQRRSDGIMKVLRALSEFAEENGNPTARILFDQYFEMAESGSRYVVKPPVKGT